MRTDLPRLALAAALLALAACAGHRVAEPAPAAAASAPVECTDDAMGCALPSDVRAWLADRAECEHFRDEPWPEGDSDPDRERRRQLVDGIRTACAGLEARQQDLRNRYRGQAAVLDALAPHGEPVEP